jgi:hypothetical protein
MIHRQGVKYINPTKQASDDWKKRINDLAAPSLFPTTRSTYMVSCPLEFQAKCDVLYAWRLPSP